MKPTRYKFKRCMTCKKIYHRSSIGNHACKPKTKTEQQAKS